MTRRSTRVIIAISALAVAVLGCADPVPAGGDAGPGSDGALDARVIDAGDVSDTGALDAPGPDEDAGPDDSGGIDSGMDDADVRPDAGLLADAGGDGGSTSDSGSPPGLDGGGGPIAIEPCNEDDWDSTDDTVISPGPFYSPRCPRIMRGMSVTLPASARHPLMRSTRGTPGSPIPAMMTSTMTIRFDAPGLYPFYCPVDGADDGSGMAGAVRVD